MPVRVIANTPLAERCAFCKKWHDPAMTVIEPVSRGVWNYEPKIQRMCTERGVETKAMSSCRNFCSKI